MRTRVFALIIALCAPCCLSAADIGSLDTNYIAAVEGGVYTVRIQGDGEAIIGGDFTTINGVSQPYLARLDAHGSVDANFTPTVLMEGSTASIWALAIQPDSKIIIAGRFTSIDGAARNCVARLNSNGSLDASFDAGSLGDQFVFAIAMQQDGMIVVGGEFTSVGGYLRNGVARLTTIGSVDTSFNPGSGMNPVRSLLVQPDGKIVAGGISMIRMNADGSADNTFSASVSSFVHSMSLQPDGKIVIGGDFTSVGSVSRNHIARINSNGTLDDAFDVGAGTDAPGNISVRTVRVQLDGSVLISGNFSAVDSTARNGLAKLNSNGSLNTEFLPQLPVGYDAWSFDFEPGGNIIVSGMERVINSTIIPEPAALALSFYAGISIEGTVGGAYRIDYAEDLNTPNWQPLTTVVLPQSPYLWIDVGSTNALRRYYRAVAQP